MSDPIAPGPVCLGCVPDSLALLDTPDVRWEMCPDHHAHVSALVAERTATSIAAIEAAMPPTARAVITGQPGAEVLAEFRRAIEELEASRVPVFCNPADEGKMRAALARDERGWGYRLVVAESVPVGKFQLFQPFSFDEEATP